MTKSKYSYSQRNDEAQKDIIKPERDGSPGRTAPNPAAVSLGPGAHDKITWEPKSLASPAHSAADWSTHSFSWASCTPGLYLSLTDMLASHGPTSPTSRSLCCNLEFTSQLCAAASQDFLVGTMTLLHIVWPQQYSRTVLYKTPWPTSVLYFSRLQKQCYVDNSVEFSWQLGGETSFFLIMEHLLQHSQVSHQVTWYR